MICGIFLRTLLATVIQRFDQCGGLSEAVSHGAGPRVLRRSVIFVLTLIGSRRNSTKSDFKAAWRSIGCAPMLPRTTGSYGVKLRAGYSFVSVERQWLNGQAHRRRKAFSG